MKLLVYLETLAIDLYRSMISPYLGNCCRYDPTCSRYAVLALCKHGFLRGNFKAAWRLLRCAPWGGSGEDQP